MYSRLQRFADVCWSLGVVVECSFDDLCVSCFQMYVALPGTSMCYKHLQTPIIQNPKSRLHKLHTALPLMSLHEGLCTRFSCCASWASRRCCVCGSVCGRVSWCVCLGMSALCAFFSLGRFAYLLGGVSVCLSPCLFGCYVCAPVPFALRVGVVSAFCLPVSVLVWACMATRHCNSCW